MGKRITHLTLLLGHEIGFHETVKTKHNDIETLN